MTEFPESEVRKVLAANLARVREDIAAAARKAGRSPDDVRFVAITKYVSSATARLLVELGCHDLGESRPQELWNKAAAIEELEGHWHLVGHLQRNKVRKTLPLVRMIHSCDSERLLREINENASRLNLRPRLLLQVNISGEAAKHGLEPGGVEPLLAGLGEFPHVEICGMMAMASLEGGLDQARREFRQLRELRDRLKPCCPPGIDLGELSMGMSRDFREAVAEGATIVRVGSTLFEGLPT